VFQCEQRSPGQTERLCEKIDCMELGIIMLSLNEAETLKRCIREAMGYLERSGVSGEVVVGDNGSTDGSQLIALNCGARVVEVPLRGSYGDFYVYDTAASLVHSGQSMSIYDRAAAGDDLSKNGQLRVLGQGGQR
jgi:glycosyltransferase involved in cell wall biosynthesis